MIEDDLDVENIEEKIVEKLETCVESLLSCEIENKKCKRCKDKANCLLFIRAVLAALCRIQIANINGQESVIPEHLYS